MPYLQVVDPLHITTARTSWAPAQDTLYYTVEAGEVLIFALPVQWEANTVEKYSIIHAPALSWLVDRSFFWRTLEEDTGRHILQFNVDYTDVPVDTLVVSVHVE